MASISDIAAQCEQTIRTAATDTIQANQSSQAADRIDVLSQAHDVNAEDQINVSDHAGPGDSPNASMHSYHQLAINSNFYNYLNFIQLIILLSLISFLTWFIFNLYTMNDDSHFGAMEIVVLFWILRSIWSVLNSIWVSVLHQTNTEPTTCLQISVILSNFTGIAWCVSAIFMLFINPSTDKKSQSYYICSILFWLTITVYLLPKVSYILVCALLYLVLYLMVRFNPGLTNSPPKTPIEIIEKLKVIAYKDAKDEILEFGANDNASSRMNSISLDYAKPTCPICIVDLSFEDLIIIMPCDGRHYFHKECLHTWLLRSQECPICRTNIVQSIEAEEALISAAKQPSHSQLESTANSPE